MERFDSPQMIKNLASSVILFLLQMGIGFVLTPMLIDAFGIGSFGIIRLATSITLYVGIISKSFSGAVDRFFVIEIQKGNKEEANQILNTSLFINIFFFLLTLPVLAFVSLNTEKFFSIPESDISSSHFLFMAVQINFFINIFTSPFYAPSSANNRVDVKNGIEIINRVLNLSLSIVVAKYFSYSIGNLGYVYFIVGFVNLLLVVYFGYKFAPYLKLGVSFISKDKAKSLLKMSIWLLFDAIGTIIFLNSDIIFANTIYGAEVGGKFGAVLVTVTMVRSIGNIFSKSISPVIYKAYSSNKLDLLQNLVYKSSKIISLFMGIIIGLLGAYSTNLLYLWLGPDFTDLWWLVMFLQIPRGFTLAMSPIHITRTASNKISIPTIILIVSGLLNIAAIYFLGGFLHFSYIIIPLVSSIVFNIRHAAELIYLLKIKILTSSKIFFAVFSGFFSIIISFIIGKIMVTILYGSSWGLFLFSGFSAFTISLFVVWQIFLNNEEKKLLLDKIKEGVKR